MHGTIFRLGTAVVSRPYVGELFQSRPSSEGFGLQLSWSEGFELLEREGRREGMRVVVGLFRFLRSRI